jgi:ketol-acid reductoisomerase
LAELRESEMWQAGKTVRSLRPENQKAPVAAPVESSTKSVFREQTEKSESIG